MSWMVTQDFKPSFSCCNSVVISNVLLCPVLQKACTQEAWFAWKFHLLALKMHRQWRWQKSYRTFQAPAAKGNKTQDTILSCPNKNAVRPRQSNSENISESFLEHDWSDIPLLFVCIHAVHTHYTKGIHQYTLCWPNYKSTGEYTCNTKD